MDSSIDTLLSKGQNDHEGEQNIDCQGLEVEEGVTINGQLEGVFLSNGNVLHPDLGDGYVNLYMTKIHRTIDTHKISEYM